MSGERARLRRWLGRARPSRAGLARASGSGLLAAATSVALFVGAVGLLVAAAQRPGLRAVAGVLILIELFAFLRSPIRFAERTSAHRLGFDAVTSWRRWVVVSVGGWSYARWRRYAAGDLLERALTDTDELQDLWVRGALPLATAVATMVAADVAVALVPPAGSYVAVALVLALVQALGVSVLLAGLAARVVADRSVRAARSAYQATLVELSGAAPELLLLGGDDLVERRSREPLGALRAAERGRRRLERLSSAVAPITSLAALAVLAAHHPATSPVWLVVVALLALATYELVAAARDAVGALVAVSAAAERLESLEEGGVVATRPWPEDATVRASHLRVEEDGATIVRGLSLEVRAGRRVALTGPSGAGKSTLLRVLAGLDAPASGELTVGGVALAEIAEDELRRHLAYVASEPGLLSGLVGDVMAMGRASARDALADLRRVGLDADARTRWDEISRGERQRAAVVRALVTGPSVLILDEPTSGLGRDETSQVLDLIGAAGPSVIVATHDEQVMGWCDVVVDLRDGALSFLRR